MEVSIYKNTSNIIKKEKPAETKLISNPINTKNKLGQSISAQFYKSNYVAFLGSNDDSSQLSKTEIRNLILDYQQNNSEKSLDKLVKGHEKLVKGIVKKYLDKGVDYDDLKQEAILGLIKAIKNADPYSSYEFSTYAYPSIKGHIVRMLQKSKTVNYSGKVTDLLTKYSAIQSNLQQKLDRDPTKEEIMVAMVRDPDILDKYQDNIEGFKRNYEYLLDYLKKTKSLHEEVKGRENQTFEELISCEQLSPEDSFISDNLENEVTSIIRKKLTPKESKTVELMYLNGYPPEQVANDLKITKSETLETIVTGLKKLIHEPEFLDLKSVNEIKSLKAIISRFETESYINHINKTIPEFECIINQIAQQTGKAPKPEEIKNEIRKILNQSNLTDLQMLTMEWICRLNGERIVISDSERIQKLGMTRDLVSIHKMGSMKKIIKVLEENYGYKKDTNPTIYEIKLFSKNFDELIKKANLTKKEELVVYSLFDENDKYKLHKQIAEELGYKDGAHIAEHVNSITKKFIKIIEENPSLKPEYPDYEDIKNKENLDKVLSILTDNQKEIAILLIQGKSSTEITQILGKSSETLKGHKRNILSRFQKLLPNNYDNLEKMVNNLTDQQYRTLELLNQGKSFSEISNTLNISDKTLASVIGSIKLKCPDEYENLKKTINQLEEENKNIQCNFTFEEILLFSDFKKIVDNINLDDKCKNFLQFIYNDGKSLKGHQDLIQKGYISEKICEYKKQIKPQIFSLINKDKDLQPVTLSLEQIKEKENLEKFLSVLTESQKNAVELILQGKGPSEIAAELNVSAGSVNNRKAETLTKWEKIFPNYYTELKRALTEKPVIPEIKIDNNLSLYEIALFSDNFEEILEKAELLDKEYLFAKNLIDDNGLPRSNQELVEILGFTNTSHISTYKAKITQKLQKTLTLNKSLIPDTTNIVQKENMDKFLSVLTEKQREVMELLIEGKSYQEIGDMLKVVPRSILGHRDKALKKWESLFPNCYKDLEAIIKGRASKSITNNSKEKESTTFSLYEILLLSGNLEALINKADLTPGEERLVQFLRNKATDSNEESESKLATDNTVYKKKIMQKFSKVIKNNKKLAPKKLSQKEISSPEYLNIFLGVLTDKQRQATKMLIEGKLYNDISEELGITLEAVRAHKNFTLKKWQLLFPNYYNDLEQIMNQNRPKNYSN